MLKLSILTVGGWQMNCYLLSDPESAQAILIDPGDEADRILDWIRPFQINHILITHGDQDHIGALDQLREATGAPVGIHPNDAERFGVQSDFPLAGGTTVKLEDYIVHVLHVPGHTPGSVVLHLPKGSETPLAVVGDAIFPRGPGHTTSHQELLKALDSLAHTVFTWSDDTVLYPGHGESTSVGKERSTFEEFHNKSLPPDIFGDVTWRDA